VLLKPWILGKEENQLDATKRFIDKSILARHASGNDFAHLQEH